MNIIWTLFYGWVVVTQPVAPVIPEIPQTITVRVTGQSECHADIWYKIEEIELKEYVKHVLAAEWGHDWSEESLKAGAIAVKQYAIRSVIDAGPFIETQVLWKGEWQDGRILEGGKWLDAHVYDCNWDQVYNPALDFETVNNAVEETWNWYLVDEEGDFVKPYYNAWMGGCEEQGAENCMSQWGTKQDAENGMSWDEIVHKYYAGQLVYNDKYD